MAQEEQTTASPGSTENSMGLRSFNRTGQENTTADVIRPAARPEARRRNAVLIPVVIVAVVVMAWLAYLRSGLSFIPSNDTGPGLTDHATTGDPDSSN